MTARRTPGAAGSPTAGRCARPRARASSANSMPARHTSGCVGSGCTGLMFIGLPLAAHIASISAAVVAECPSRFVRGDELDRAAAGTRRAPPASAISSSGAARFDGTGPPSWSTCISSCDDVKPTAPSRMASWTSAAISATSSGGGGALDRSSPMTKRRTAEWPTWSPTFTPSPPPSTLAANSACPPPANVAPTASVSGGMPSTRLSILSIQGTSAGRAGKSENPQLPVITVVTPCHDDGDAVGSQCSCAS